MPLPLAHSAAGLAGYVLFSAGRQKGSLKEEGLLLGTSLFLANSPDLDFLPGILAGRANAYHHGPTHSILFNAGVLLLFYYVAGAKWRSVSRERILGCFSVALFSHLALDYFSMDTGKPHGIPLLWPILPDFFISPLPLFGDVKRAGGGAVGFIRSLFNWSNAREAAVESLFSGMLLLAVTGWMRRKNVRLVLMASAAFLVLAFLYCVLHFRLNPF